jgi:glycosyltransferase involved in cell wall biosynthesis
MKRSLLYITNDCWWDTDINVLDDIGQHFSTDVYVSSCKDIRINKYPIKNVSKNIKLHNANYIRSKRNLKMILGSILYFIEIFTKREGKYIFYVMDNNPYYNILFYIFVSSQNTIISLHNYVDHTDSPKWQRCINKLFLKKYKNYHLQSYLQELEFKIANPLIKCFSTKMSLKNFGPSQHLYNIQSTGKRTFLFFGYIRDYKRLDLFIKAANIIGDNAHYVIAGNAKDWEKYEGQIENFKNFTLNISFIPNENIPDYFTQADFIVLPYSDTTQSGPLLIAYNYNLPSIVSDLSFFKEMVCNNMNGFIFKSNDLNDLVKKMSKAVSLTELEYKKMKEEQIKMSNKYSQSINLGEVLVRFIENNMK